MEKRNFQIGFKLIWSFLVLDILVVILAAIAKVQHWDQALFLYAVGLAIFCFLWLIILYDIIQNKIYHKGYWITLMIVIPMLALISYLVQREKLMRLGKRFAR